MSIAGFSINLITLFALVLVIGTVVDDAIVVVEAVQARFDVGSHRFVVEKGTFEILAGPSSADLPLKATVVL